VQKPITIHRVIADFDRNDESSLVDTAHCLGLTDVFNNTSIGADQWNWTFGNGETFNGENPPQITYDTPGTYTIQLSVRDQTLGCVDTLEKVLEVFPIPNITALGGNMCEDDFFELSSTIESVFPVSYAWSPSETLDDSTLANPTATPPLTTEYVVIATDTNACADTATAQVVVLLRPEANEWDTVIVIGEQVQLNVDLGGSYSYSWTPSEGLSCTDCPVLTARPLEDTDYTVTISDSAGCFEVPSFYRFEVKPETTIDVPTNFTPNGDNSNDLIFVRGWGIQSLVEFKIYNRWGQLVFETSDINQGWDGYFNGKPQSNDTYTFHAVVRTWLLDVNGQYNVLKKTGSFNLVR
jgi:gliding motility-associated-like protein